MWIIVLNLYKCSYRKWTNSHLKTHFEALTSFWVAAILFPRDTWQFQVACNCLACIEQYKQVLSKSVFPFSVKNLRNKVQNCTKSGYERRATVKYSSLLPFYKFIDHGTNLYLYRNPAPQITIMYDQWSYYLCYYTT